MIEKIKYMFAALAMVLTALGMTSCGDDEKEAATDMWSTTYVYLQRPKLGSDVIAYQGVHSDIPDVNHNRIAMPVVAGLSNATDTDITVKLSFTADERISPALSFRKGGTVVIPAGKLFASDTLDLDIEWPASPQEEVTYDIPVTIESIVPASDGRSVSSRQSSIGIKVVKPLFRVTTVEEIRVTLPSNPFRVIYPNQVDLSQYVTVLPAYAPNKTVKYSMLAGNASIDENTGVLTPLGTGAFYVVVQATDGSEKSALLTGTIEKNYIPLNRSAWEVIPSHTTAFDAGINGSPAMLIDDPEVETPNTCINQVKPGRSAGGVSVASGDEVFFVIDMKTPQEFNYFRLVQRNDQALYHLWVWSCDFYTSQDGESYTLVKENIQFPHTALSQATQYYEFDRTYTARYIKFQHKSWYTPTDKGTCIQLRDFQLGTL